MTLDFTLGLIRRISPSRGAASPGLLLRGSAWTLDELESKAVGSSELLGCTGDGWAASVSLGWLSFANTVTFSLHGCAGRMSCRLERVSHFSHSFSYSISPDGWRIMTVFRYGAISFERY